MSKLKYILIRNRKLICRLIGHKRGCGLLQKIAPTLIVKDAVSSYEPTTEI